MDGQLTFLVTLPDGRQLRRTVDRSMADLMAAYLDLPIGADDDLAGLRLEAVRETGPSGAPRVIRSGLTHRPGAA